MLWDLIRDFFVQHVFGGCDSGGSIFNVSGGQLYSYLQENGTYEELSTNASDYMYKVSSNEYCSLSDWLSTTATIISITIIVVLCCMFVYRIVKLIGGLIR